MKITRRSFIKTLGISTALVMSPLGVVKAFSTPKPKKGSVLDILEHELRRQPMGSVAHSIFGLEQDTIDRNVVLVSGWSISRNGKSMKHWMQTINREDYFIKGQSTWSPFSRKNVIDNILKKLKQQWINDHKRWGKAPKRFTKKRLLAIKAERGQQIKGIF